MADPTSDLPAWYELAGRAFWQQVHDLPERAGATVERIAREHTPNVIPHVLLTWIDTMLSRGTAPEPGQPVWLGFVDAETGARTDATGVPPHVAWAGQLIAARAADDQDTAEALIASTPDAAAWAARVAATLALCAFNVRATMPELGARRG